MQKARKALEQLPAALTPCQLETSLDNIDQELLEACAAGNATKVQHILDQPVRVEGLDELISLSLKESMERKQPDIVELLLERTPKLQYSDNLMLLAFQGGWEIYQLFLSKDPNILEYQHQQLSSVLCLSVTGGNLQFLSRLLEAGADPGWTTNSPRSYWVTLPIEFAASSGLLDITKLLLRYGAILNPTAALQCAVFAGRPDMVRLLIESGANVNGIELGVNSNPVHPALSETALHFAAKRGFMEICELLLENGADPTIRDGEGQTPIDAVKQSSQEDIVQLLEEASPQQSPSSSL